MRLDPLSSASAASTVKKLSFGCELQPSLFESIPSLSKLGLLDHVQITIPSTIPFATALNFSQQVAVIAHTNLLNTFGENSWSELQPVARQINRLGPVHVVEHFTMFRPTSREKTGVYFDLALTKRASIDRIVANVETWQNLVQKPICLENISLADNVTAYFDLLLEVRSRTSCQIACDLPHMLLSAASAGYTRHQITQLASDLNATQVHVGGLSIAQGIIRDNHKLFSPWIAGLAFELFPCARYVTLEQNHLVPSATVKKQLEQLQAKPMASWMEFSEGSAGLELSDINDEIAQETARANEFPPPIRHLAETDLLERNVEGFESAIDIYKKYLPFMFPVASLDRGAHELAPVDLVRTAACFAKWSLSYLTWWYPEASGYAHITYGEGHEAKFSKAIFGPASALGDDTPVGSQTVRFNSKKGFWVEVATPKIEELLRREEKQ